MSERGSFVSEYIYCKKCFSAVFDVLKNDKSGHIDSPMRVGSFPIVAGKLSGMAHADALYNFNDFVLPKISDAICHDVKIALFPEGHSGVILTIKPSQKDDAVRYGVVIVPILVRVWE